MSLDTLTRLWLQAVTNDEANGRARTYAAHALESEAQAEGSLTPRQARWGELADQWTARTREAVTGENAP
jgi:hypothetical protein